MKNLSKNLFWVIAALFFIALLFSSFISPELSKTKELTLGELVQKINAGEVKRIEVSGNDLKVTFTDDTKAVSRKEAEAGFTETLKNFGVDGARLQATEIKVSEPGGAKYWLGILVPALLPVIVMVLIFWWIFRQAKTGVNQAFSFGKANIRLFAPSKDKVTFKDVAGLKESKEELQEVVDFLKHSKKFLDIGARIPRGVLLMGPPGTGKTLMARATAGGANGPFFYIAAT